jgi:hypothetical protein
MNKRYFYLLLSITTATIILLSCKKFLNQKPITEVGSDLVFKDVQSTYKAIAGVYSRLVGDQAYGIRVSLYYTVDNDEMQGPTGNVDDDRRGLARYSATPANAQINSPFLQLFQGIEYANICIYNIPKMDMFDNGTDQQRKQLKRMLGEALTLRAQFYFEAIRNWGDLPAHWLPAAVQATSNPFPSRTNHDSLYDHLLNDLKDAEDLVPWKNDLAAIGDPIDERITKATVKGVRARIALFRGGYSLYPTGGIQRASNYQIYYQIAKDECNDIINSGQHTLNPSYKSVWKNQVCAHAVADPNGELIFQASAIGLSGAEDTKLGYYNGPTVNGNGNKSINVLPSYFYLFDSSDQRRDVTCAPYNVAADGATKIGQPITAICDGKYRRDWISNPTVSPTNAAQYFGLKWQILRYSDVLLMYAEAENELNGPTASAYNAINMVRRRGYGKPIGTPDLTIDVPAGLAKSEFFKFIVRERALELGGEGVRKYDLIRWNLLSSALSESRANMNRMAVTPNPTPMVSPTYMAGYPSYCLTANLPIAMYYKNSNTADDYTLWYNSFYVTAPTATPSGTTKVAWLTSAINATGPNSPVGRYATGYVNGKGELLPIPQPAILANANLTQNPLY